MKRTAWIGLWTLLHVHLLCAQTVSTIVPGGSGIDEALFRSAGGVLYGTGYDNGTLNTFAGGPATVVLDALDRPSEMAERSDGRIAVAESQGHRVVLFDPVDQSRTVLTSTITNPAGIIKLPDGDSLLVSSASQNALYRVAPNGDTSLYLSNPLLNAPVSMVWDDAQNLYIANYSDGHILRRAPDGSVSVFCTLPTSSLGHIVRSGNSIYATGVFTHEIYSVDIADGSWMVFAGASQGSVDGGLDVALFDSPNGIAVSATGDSLFISEYNTKAVRLISGISTAVGVHQPLHVQTLQGLRVWPNPVRGTFYLECGAEREPLHLQLFDAQGALILANVQTQSLGEGLHQLNLPARCSEGLYVLQRTTRTGVEAIRLYLSRD